MTMVFVFFTKQRHFFFFELVFVNLKIKNEVNYPPGRWRWKWEGNHVSGRYDLSLLPHNIKGLFAPPSPPSHFSFLSSFLSFFAFCVLNPCVHCSFFSIHYFHSFVSFLSHYWRTLVDGKFLVAFQGNATIVLFYTSFDWSLCFVFTEKKPEQPF